MKIFVEDRTKIASQGEDMTCQRSISCQFQLSFSLAAKSSFIFLIYLHYLFIHFSMNNNTRNDSDTSEAQFAPVSKMKSVSLIKVKISNFSTADSLTITSWDVFVSESISKKYYFKRETKTIDSSGFFSFKLDNLGKPLYFSISKGVDKLDPAKPLNILGKLLAEPGDSMTVLIDSALRVIDYYEGKEYITGFSLTGVRFTGKGAAKNKIKHFIESNLSNRVFGLQQSPKQFNGIEERAKYRFGIFDSLLENSLAYLESYRDDLSDISFQVLKSNVLVDNRIKKIKWLTEEAGQAAISGSALLAQISTELFNEDILQGFDEKIKDCSLYYPTYLYLKELYLSGIKRDDLDFVFKRILTSYNGLTKEKVLTYFIFENRDRLKRIDTILKTTRQEVTSNGLSSIVGELASRRSSSMINAVLTNEMSEAVKLNKFKGKVLFIDFWFTGCSSCAEFYKKKISVLEEKYGGEENIVFISVSVDGSFDIWQRGLRKGIYTSNDINNFYTNGNGSMDPIIQFLNIGAYPFQAIIGKDFKIVSLNSNPATPLIELDSILKKAISE